MDGGRPVSESAARGGQPRRVGLLFAGGPAPGANAVISSAVAAFRRDGFAVLGFYRGFTHLENYDGVEGSLREGEHFSLVSWAGLTVAILGLIYLVSPGLTAPS